MKAAQVPVVKGEKNIFEKISNSFKCFFNSIVNFLKSLFKLNNNNEIKVLKPRITVLPDLPAVNVKTVSVEEIDGKQYAISKLKEIEDRKLAALKLAQEKEPGRWPPNITEMPPGPASTKKSVGSLTAADLKGKRYIT